jgi:hypothetical protein
MPLHYSGVISVASNLQPARKGFFRGIMKGRKELDLLFFGDTTLFEQDIRSLFPLLLFWSSLFASFENKFYVTPFTHFLHLCNLVSKQNLWFLLS